MSTIAENVNTSTPGWRPDQPFNEIPLLPPSVQLEPPRILKQCIGARTALAGLKEAAQNLPNQALLIQTLPLLEAQASSEIESIVTTTDELLKHPEITESMDPATKEALQYRAAKANHPPTVALPT